jgi:3',5'-cyclic AMP phosphodiesterase CpdA
MFKRRSWGHLKIKIALLVLCILVLAVLGRAADKGALPATDWNPVNLSQIKVSPAGPLTFAVFGDNRGEHPAVFASLLQEMDRDRSLPFVIHLGDMVMKANLDRYRTFFTSVRQNFHKPFLSVIGNHELYGDQGLALYREMFGQDDYTFQINQNYFIVLNDAAKEGLGPGQLQWLENELKKSQKDRTRLVFLHVPLYDPRGGDNHHCLRPQQAGQLLALFKKYKVTYIFAAHIHDYYTGVWDGLPYTITGGAGAKLYGNDPQHAFYHYLKVTVKGDKVQVQVRRLANQEE